jgi:hypothetical protein
VRARRNGGQIEVVQDETALAVADIRTTANRHVARAELHLESGHLPTGVGSRLVDAILEQPEFRAGSRIELTLPLGATGSLDRLRERCTDVCIHPAGVSCLVEANVARCGTPTERTSETSTHMGRSYGDVMGV